MIRNGTCGVWVNNAYPVVNDLECHLPALAPFFPSAELIKSNYRYDGVLGFASLAGCGYKASPSVDGVGEFGVHSVKMYSTFKRPFFHRQSGRWRHVKELLPYDAWNCDSKKENYFAFMFGATHGMERAAYPCRLEISVSYNVAWEFEDNGLGLPYVVIFCIEEPAENVKSQLSTPSCKNHLTTNFPATLNINSSTVCPSTSKSLQTTGGLISAGNFFWVNFQM
ncbi:hypothetical protein [Absidia glauca]|uniref:Uncharacterized protein n=1 Tax=Absidia glauca TaxID=4829 RepID=A0A168NJ29_ABSGL|nr:hypothetical protein [Absidia glauca]